LLFLNTKTSNIKVTEPHSLKQRLKTDTVPEKGMISLRALNSSDYIYLILV
jgi:hypothetical protein